MAATLETILYGILTFAAVNGVLIFIIVSALAGHITFLLVLGRVPSLNKPAPKYLLVSLSAANLVVVVTLLFASISTFAQQWLMGAELCLVSAYLSTLGFNGAAHTMGILALERYLRVCRPLKHDEVFNRVTVKLLIGGLWFFDAVLSAFPLVGWGEYGYIDAEYQCRSTVGGWQKSFSHLNFTVVLGIAFPLTLAAVCLALVAKQVRQRVKIEQEERRKLAVESYGSKLRRLQDAIRKEVVNANGKKKRKKRAKKRVVKARAGTDGDSSSSEDETKVPEGHKKYVRARREQRLSRYRAQEVRLAWTVCWMWAGWLLCWLPYLSCAYMRVWEWPAVAASSAAILSVTWLSSASAALNPLIYFIANKNIRKALISFVTGKTSESEQDNTKKVASSSSSNSEDEQGQGDGGRRPELATGSQVSNSSSQAAANA